MMDILEMDVERSSIRAAFKTEAVVDWIELTICLEQPTQFRYVQAALCTILELTKIHVRPLGPGGGLTTRRFAFRLHDVHANTLTELLRITSALSKSFPFSAPPEVSAIEIALDFRSKRTDNADIPNMVALLQTSIAAYGNPRQFDPTKSLIPKHCNVHLAVERLPLDPKLNLRIGNKRDPVQWQVYDKTVDKNKQPVEPEERRARVEFTLSGDAFADRVLGQNRQRLVTLDDLSTFKFETLAGLLHFRQLKPVVSLAAGKESAVTWIHRTLESSGRSGGITNYPLGKIAVYRDKSRPIGSGRQRALKNNGHSVAHAELNDIARRKLKALTNRFV